MESAAKNPAYVFDWLYFTDCLTSFPSIDHHLCLCAGFFDSVSSNTNEVLSINPSANVFVFGDFNVHHKDWLTYSVRTDRSGELCCNFSISNNLTSMGGYLLNSVHLLLPVNFVSRFRLELMYITTGVDTGCF